MTSLSGFTQSYGRVVMLVAIVALVIVGFFIVMNWQGAQPTDFVSTFYLAAKHLLRNDPVYSSVYTYPIDGTQHPPYNPIWILYAAVPLSVFPINIAGSLRFLIDLASLPLLAYFSARWAGLTSFWRGMLLAIAPWLSILLYSGQWSSLALIGAILCYKGLGDPTPSC